VSTVRYPRVASSASSDDLPVPDMPVIKTHVPMARTVAENSVVSEARRMVAWNGWM
jgi:hypothetical protein